MAETAKSLSDLFSLNGKRALITGSAAGIGKAIALRWGQIWSWQTSIKRASKRPEKSRPV